MLENIHYLEEIRQEPATGKLSADFFESLEASHPASPQPRPIPVPTPAPFQFGSRFLIWKQDPSVGALGQRLALIPQLVLNGPRDARIDTELAEVTPVIRNTNSDFIFAAGSGEGDCAHTYAVVRQTLTMYERAQDGKAIPWAWNRNGNTDVLTVLPRGFAGANAFYSRNGKRLSFGHFTPQGGSAPVFTCRSLDIVSHECGHAVLDGLKPGWLGSGNPPQTGGLHESFGDTTAIFLALSQLDQVDALIAMTKANLHAKNFLAAVAEQFGASIGRPMGLRNADNDLKLSQVSNEVHAISQVFTGGIYDVLADIFAFEQNRQRRSKDPAHVLLEVAAHLRGLLLKAYIHAPDVGATYADVVNKMLMLSHGQGDPPIYRTFIRNRFTFREIMLSPIPLTAMASGRIDMDNKDFTEGGDIVELENALPNHPSLTAAQDRSGCCGTMQSPEYAQAQATLDANLQQLTQTAELISEKAQLADEIAQLAQAFK